MIASASNTITAAVNAARYAMSSQRLRPVTEKVAPCVRWTRWKAKVPGTPSATTTNAAMSAGDTTTILVTLPRQASFPRIRAADGCGAWRRHERTLRSCLGRLSILRLDLRHVLCGDSGSCVVERDHALRQPLIWRSRRRVRSRRDVKEDPVGVQRYGALGAVAELHEHLLDGRFSEAEEPRACGAAFARPARVDRERAFAEERRFGRAGAAEPAAALEPEAELPFAVSVGHNGPFMAVDHRPLVVRDRGSGCRVHIRVGRVEEPADRAGRADGRSDQRDRSD